MPPANSSAFHRLGTPALLLGLLAAGVLTIWHLGHNILSNDPGPAQVEESQVRAPAPETPLPQSPEKDAQEAPSIASTGTEMEDPAETPDAAPPEKMQASAPPSVQSLPTTPPQPTGSTGFPGLKYVSTERGRFIASEPILFNTGLDKIRDSSLPVLDRLAALLTEQTEFRVRIIGHTDNLGTESVNQKLSADRARAVLDYLVTKGVEQHRLESVGMGSTLPIASNDDRLGRQANRRIEFQIINPGKRS